MPINPVQQANVAALAILNELIATGNLYDGAKLHLCQGAVPTGPNVTVSDFTVCDFTGYATSTAIVWVPAFLSPSNVPTIAGDAKNFNTGASPTIFNTVSGWYVTDGAGTDLLFWRQFDTPIVLNYPFQGFDVVPAIPAYLAS